MSSKYNLNEKAGQDYFEFILDDHTYKMAYPSSRQVMQLTEITSDNTDYEGRVAQLQVKLETDPTNLELQKELKEVSDKAKLAQSTFIDWCAGFITASPEAPEIKEALLSKSVKYLLAFMNMVQTELGN